ncbi:MAG: glycosyltransferase family 2 protein [Kiritimatiellae bacterium]|nr:glycosyltransferase family 2 protein [Kiritimatiellia bacterium]
MTVIIPTWQTRALLLKCLEGLLTGDATPVRRPAIVVVDNASTDGSADAVTAHFPSVTVLRNSRNAGYAAAVNRGLQHVLSGGGDGPLALLNPDTLCAPATLDLLAGYLDSHPRAGLVAPRLRQSDGQPQPFAFGGDPTPAYLLRRGWQRRVHGRYLHDWGDLAQETVDWVSFACVAVRAMAARQTGPLDERFFMYFEDNDWCLRARRAGWTVARDTRAEVVHLGGASLKQSDTARKAYRRSLLYFQSKHYGAAAALLMRILLPLYRL